MVEMRYDVSSDRLKQLRVAGIHNVRESFSLEIKEPDSQLKVEGVSCPVPPKL